MLPTALVPIRISRTAKRRLAHVLSPGERRALMQRSFDHVATVLSDAGLGVIALSPEPVPGIETWPDHGGGLNAVVAEACSRVEGPCLIVHADLPWLSVDDVFAVLDADGDVVIARSTDGGTNGLLLRRPMRTHYGPSSALRHAAAARALGHRAQVLDIEGFAMDIDDDASLIRAGRRRP